MTSATAIPAPEILTRPTGLSDEEARKLLRRFGANVVKPRRKLFIMRAARELVHPAPVLLLTAAGLSYYARTAEDTVLILGLVACCYLLQFGQEYCEHRTASRLERQLMPTVAALRGEAWKRIRAEGVVPGDRVALRLGSLVPADLKLSVATNLSVNEFTLTGESLPREKVPGDTVYAGSFIATGSGEGVVTQTGPRTYYGAALHSIAFETLPAELKRDRAAVSRALLVVALSSTVGISAALALSGVAFATIAAFDVALLLIGVPTTFSTVISSIINAGVTGLAAEGVVLRKLKSLRKLANINLLLCDKTGTLTESRILVSSIVTFGSWHEPVALALAASATDAIKTHPLEAAVRAYALSRNLELMPQASFIPGDSGRRRGTAVFEQGGTPWTVSLGAPATVATLCRFSAAASTLFSQSLETAARRGDHALLVAVAQGSRQERNLEPVALIFFSDTLRADAAQTITALHARGVDVKMLTGDSVPLASELAKTLGLTGTLHDRSVIEHPEQLREQLPHAGGFAEVLPKDKYTVVEAGKQFAHVAVTGEEVHDIPAVLYADIGFAVAHSVDALHAAADVVLTLEGIATIDRAIARGRAILLCLYHYFFYRLSGTASIVLSLLIVSIIARDVPLAPVQLLLLAFLTDVPLLSLAFDTPRAAEGVLPADRTNRTVVALVYAAIGTASGACLWLFSAKYLVLPQPLLQTALFLELAVFGYLLIYLAHTDDTWFRTLPHASVMLAGGAAAALATGLACFGLFMAALPLWICGFVWLWAFCFMQIAAGITLVIIPFFSAPTAPAV